MQINHTNSDGTKLVGVKEMADILEVCERTIFNMVRDKQIPHIKIRRLTRFNPKAVLAALATPIPR